MLRGFTRRMIAALLGLLAALAFAGSAFAGGWSVTILDNGGPQGVGANLQAGVPFSVGFTVLQHGRHPLDNLSPMITLTHVESGDVVSVTAHAEGAAGHYVAEITLPKAGSWEWQIAAFGEPAALAPLSIAAAPAPAPAAPASAPVAATQPGTPTGLIALMVAMALAIGLALLAFRLYRPATA